MVEVYIVVVDMLEDVRNPAGVQHLAEVCTVVVGMLEVVRNPADEHLTELGRSLGIPARG